MTPRTEVANLLEKFGMQECRPQVTPLVPGETLKALKYHPELVPVSAKEHTRFMSVVGSIQYIASVTRPDIAFAASALAQHFSQSDDRHWLAALHSLRYLQYTKKKGLVFDGSDPNAPLLEAWSDADFAKSENMKSVTGTLIKVYGQPVYWK